MQSGILFGPSAAYSNWSPNIKIPLKRAYRRLIENLAPDRLDDQRWSAFGVWGVTTAPRKWSGRQNVEWAMSAECELIEHAGWSELLVCAVCECAMEQWSVW